MKNIMIEKFIFTTSINERLNILKYKKYLKYNYEDLSGWLKTSSITMDIFEKYLLTNNIEKEEFSKVINKEFIKENKIPLIEYIQETKWFNYFNEVLSTYDSEKNNTYNKIEDNSPMYMLNIFIPWLNKELDLICCNIKKININYRMKEEIIENILGNTSNIYIKSLIYEYHRQKNDLQEEEKSIFNMNKFNKVNFDNSESSLEFFYRYPVIAKRLMIKINDILSYYKEVINNIDNNYYDIISTLNMDNNVRIMNFSASLGDTHGEGKFVINIKLSDNDDLIYKPKNLLISKNFYELINWFNINGQLNIMPTVLSYYNSDFTIEKKVRYLPCKSDEEVSNFYTIIGQYLAILYITFANDLHYENIIACGEYPYLIDLETLFQTSESLVKQHEFITRKSLEKISVSIRNIGLLPPLPMLNKKNTLDLSGLSGKEQVIPFKVLTFSYDINNPKFEYAETSISSQKNIPILKNNLVDINEYSYCIIDGFEKTLLFIEKNKNQIIDEIKKMSGIKVRQLLRSTQNYANYLNYASHPKYTDDYSDFEKMLLNNWKEGYLNPVVINSEIYDLQNDDIPIFYSYTDNRDILDSYENRISNFYSKSGINLSAERIQSLDSNEINFQKDILISSLNYANCEINKKNHKDLERYKMYKLSSQIKGDLNLNNIIFKIYNKIEGNSIKMYNKRMWFNLNSKNFNIVDYMDFSLDRGLSGMALLGFELEKHDINGSFNNFSKEIINTIRSEYNIMQADIYSMCSNLISICNLELISPYDINNDDFIITNLFEILHSYILKEVDKEIIFDYCNLLIRAYEKTDQFIHLSRLNEMINPILNLLQVKGYERLSQSRNIDILEILIRINKLINSDVFDSHIQILDKYIKQSIILLEEDRAEENIENYKTVIALLFTDLELIDKNKFNIIVQKYSSKIKELLLIDENFSIVFQLDFLSSIISKIENESILSIREEKIKDLSLYYEVNNSFPISSLNNIQNNSLIDGLAGLIYEMLRISDSSIASLTYYFKM